MVTLGSWGGGGAQCSSRASKRSRRYSSSIDCTQVYSYRVPGRDASQFSLSGLPPRRASRFAFRVGVRGSLVSAHRHHMRLSVALPLVSRLGGPARVARLTPHSTCPAASRLTSQTSEGDAAHTHTHTADASEPWPHTCTCIHHTPSRMHLHVASQHSLTRSPPTAALSYALPLLSV